jgi:hypothetical protein
MGADIRRDRYNYNGGQFLDPSMEFNGQNTRNPNTNAGGNNLADFFQRVVRERRQESPPWTAPSFRLLALYALLCGDEDRDSEKRADIGPFEQ